MLSLTWLVFHPIREGSPLFGMSADSINKADFALIATIEGLDETISQTVHANHTYVSTDIKWHHKFKDMFMEDATTGQASIDLTRIHDVQAT
jgi:inward rectifier potassium channel